MELTKVERAKRERGERKVTSKQSHRKDAKSEQVKQEKHFSVSLLIIITGENTISAKNKQKHSDYYSAAPGGVDALPRPFESYRAPHKCP